LGLGGLNFVFRRSKNWRRLLCKHASGDIQPPPDHPSVPRQLAFKPSYYFSYFAKTPWPIQYATRIPRYGGFTDGHMDLALARSELGVASPAQITVVLLPRTPSPSSLAAVGLLPHQRPPPPVAPSPESSHAWGRAHRHRSRELIKVVNAGEIWPRQPD
jgi:hypothetical protein